MDRYDRSGKYAAKYDYDISPDFLLSAVYEGYKAVSETIFQGHFHCCDSRDWSLDYLETGLQLLGYTDAACLVKTDFTKSMSIFAQKLHDLSESEELSKS